MKIIISVTSVLASAFSLGAQITATINRLPQGLEEIRIRNNSAISLVAFAVYAKQSTLEPRSLRDTLAAERGNPSGIAASYTPHLVYFDAMQPETRPLPPGEESVVMARGPALPDRHFFEEPIVTAGIFADGTTSGDAALLRRLILRRCNMLQAVEASLETLSDAGRRNVPRDQLIRQFKKMALIYLTPPY